MSDASSMTSETGEERYRRHVVVVLRDFADRIEKNEIAPSRFNIRAPVRVTGVDGNGNALYEIDDKRQLYVETVPVRQAVESPAKEEKSDES